MQRPPFPKFFACHVALNHEIKILRILNANKNTKSGLVWALKLYIYSLLPKMSKLQVDVGLGI